MDDYEDELRELLKKVFTGKSLNEFSSVEKDIKKIITSEVINILIEKSVSDVRFNTSDTPLMSMFEDYKNGDVKSGNIFSADVIHMYQNIM